ncbi:hypothetical protein O6H91_01G143200 [Diphasiastrum complanatum]|uniref:Uncharacterized protein n=7 Tax=Diphasiastrum complanatum TaxID=34168 RepID=A0ACC2EWX6_DIPCM|nr:hypothetical protein O6H91_01G143200 [Diphasiastrum complanatum]KAJ7570975.1 hypothetical protein O6H91_01G143200 [Diphasiastrum complanatum]KAJ7570976.1 hypothetical protein O6H91_01G143200 [Diphasiastrum complanatum]KAJ7570977.1 hypothetical protein O6H91_01G143200 [Diphasiastrum complanatum]KAJ7570978.1 hypothetical protein O6H91_01G143200 [Diphasiastrum complanatum]
MKFYEIAPSFKRLKNLKESARSRSPAGSSKHKKASPDEATTSRHYVHDDDFSNEAVLEAEELYTSIRDLPSFRAAYANFKQRYPKFSETLYADDLREEEYSHLQENGTICMDFHGLGLFSFVQRWLDGRSCSFRLSFISANLHDHALYGTAAEGTVEYDLRKRILEYLNVREDEYSMVFTASHASAFKLLGEAFAFTSCPRLLSVYDHENESLNRLIHGAKIKGAKIMSASFRWPSMRICSTNLKKLLQDKKKKREKARGMFVFPTQSEVTGTKYSYQWMTLAEKYKWKVVLDASALGPKDLDSLGLSLYRPDFMVFPFYKIFGSDQTGFACLFIKKSSLQCLEKSSSGRNLGMVRIVPLPVEDFTDQEDESERGKAESPFQCSVDSRSESNGYSPVAGNYSVEDRRVEIGGKEGRQTPPFTKPHGSSSGLMRTNMQGLPLDGSTKNFMTKNSPQAGAEGIIVSEQVYTEEKGEFSEDANFNLDYKNSTDFPPENTRIGAISVNSQEENQGAGPKTEVWGRQTESMSCTMQVQSASSAENSSNQSMLNMCHNSSPHSQSHFDQDLRHGEDKMKGGYWDPSTLAAWKRNSEASHSGIGFESMQTHSIPFYQQEAFSFRHEGCVVKSAQQISPKVSETSVSNLAYESEPETRSSGESVDDTELQENSHFHSVSHHTRSPQKLEEEIQQEQIDQVEDSYHKRLGRDNGLIDSRKVDYFPSPFTEEGEDDLTSNISSGLFVYRKKGTAGYLEPLPDDIYGRDSSGIEESEEEEHDAGGGPPQVVCRGLDHADSLGLTKVNIRLRSLIDWLVESFAKLHHARHESPHPLVEIVGPKVKYDRGAFVAFNLVDSTGKLLHPRFIQNIAEKSNIFLQLGFVSNFYNERRTQGVPNPFVAKTVATHQPSKLPVLTAALGFLSNFEDVYRLWMFVSKFLDPQFVTQEKSKYIVSNQEATS